MGGKCNDEGLNLKPLLFLLIYLIIVRSRLNN